jgi:hypothetical protein
MGRLTWPWYLGTARYDQKALREILGEKLGGGTIGDARVRLCILCNDNLHDRWATIRMAGLGRQSRRKM